MAPRRQSNSVTVNQGNASAYFSFSIANSSTGGIAAYRISASNGNVTLSPISGSPFNTGPQPSYLAIGGPFAYEANFGSSAISLFKIDVNSGVLTFVSNASMSVSIGPVQVVVTGTFL